MKKEREMPCFKCRHKCKLPGDAHIQCSDPPDVQAFVDQGGEKGAQMAKEVMEQLKENAVIRVVWPDSGVFPFRFDGLTVLLCSNFEEAKGT